MRKISSDCIVAWVGRLVLAALLCSLVLWIGPWLLSLTIVAPPSNPTVFYSSLADAFIISRYDNISEQMIYESNKGERFTPAEHDSILPLIYFRKLQAIDKMPQQIKGERVTPATAQDEVFSFHSNTTDIMSPRVHLSSLAESVPGPEGLEQPEDVFRFTSDGIEFIRMSTMTVNQCKSELFTWLMNKEKVAFPIRQYDINSLGRKVYDHGMLFVDNHGELFNMRLVGGRPSLRHILKPQALMLEHIFVTEFRNRRWLGFVFDTEGQMWTIDAHSFKFRPVGIPPIDLKRDNIFITGTQLSWTVFVSSPTKSTYYAVDSKTLKLIDVYEPEPRLPDWNERLYNALPKIHFLSQQDRFVFPRFEW